VNVPSRVLLFSPIIVGALCLALFIRSGRGTSAAPGPSLLVYCAAGAKPPVEEAARRYMQEYGVTVQLQYGGSGTLLSNIQVARTGDLFIAADNSYIVIAQEKGVVAESIPIAYMTPVIAVQKGNPKNIQSVDDLLRDDIRLVLGNPDAASIGKQTKTLLTGLGVWDRVVNRVNADGVFKPTVPDMANDLKLGTVDAGIVWDATVNQYPELQAVHVSAFDRAREQITVGVLNVTQQPTTALRFARFLNSQVGNEIFRAQGYESVEGDAWAWAPDITFFCGSVNRRAVEQVIRRFAEREGVTVNTVYNGCGILTGQMRVIDQQRGGKGFPDTYMACDRYYLDNVKDWFQEDVDVSAADIVIAVPKGNPAGIRSLQDLTKPGVRIAVGQPAQCTIGALTRTLLEKTGHYDAVMKNVVMQTASSALLVPTVATNSVDAAIAYRTDTMAEQTNIDSIAIDSPHARAVQPISIAKSSTFKHLDRRLLQAVLSARESFENAGFRFQPHAEKGQVQK